MLSCVLLSCVTPQRARAAAPDSLAAPAYPAPQVRAWQMGLLRADRLEHASLSATLAAGATLVSGRPRTAALGVIGIGVVKELWDRHHGGFDPIDLTADVIGAVLGSSVASAGP